MSPALYCVPAVRSGARAPSPKGPCMSKRLYYSCTALAVASTVLIAACSSDTLTSPGTASLSLAAAPTISVQKSVVWAAVGLCYPGWRGSTRGCPSSGSLYISNTGGGTLNFTATKNATWIKRSPRTGTAPSTVKVWVDGTGLPSGDYYGSIKVWATGATNSPTTVSVVMHRR
jgi:hypothetical protein